MAMLEIVSEGEIAGAGIFSTSFVIVTSYIPRYELVPAYPMQTERGREGQRAEEGERHTEQGGLAALYALHILRMSLARAVQLLIAVVCASTFFWLSQSSILGLLYD
jgi:hypothetical protein